MSVPASLCRLYHAVRGHWGVKPLAKCLPHSEPLLLQSLPPFSPHAALCLRVKHIYAFRSVGEYLLTPNVCSATNDRVIYRGATSQTLFNDIYSQALHKAHYHSVVLDQLYGVKGPGQRTELNSVGVTLVMKSQFINPSGRAGSVTEAMCPAD